MRFMMLMIPQVYRDATPDFRPSADAVAAMMKYNQALKDAGALVSLDGLHPPATAARVRFEGGKPGVTDGPLPKRKKWSAATGSST
jgi:hypothetical protein